MATVESDAGEGDALATGARTEGRNLLLRAYLQHEWLRYVVSAAVVLVITLLVPALLNNMILMLAGLLGGVVLVPALLQRRR